jgi:hypothetical protein
MLRWLLTLAVSALIFGLPSALLLRPYGRVKAGFLVGTLLGPLGLIAALIDRRDRASREAQTEPPPDSGSV